MKKIITLLLLTIQAMVATAQGYLEVGDVRYTGWTEPMSIDTLVFEVKPKGLYAEVGMYFNFSVRDTYFQDEYDSLEIVMVFKLPEEVEVTDMWLWVWDSIVHAGMYDRWTAEEIYEGIVNRRTDPAILYKYDEYVKDYYMFRIFPMAINQPRKAKITYLIPIQDLQDNPHIPLPANIINLSNTNILSCKIKYYPQAGMGEPSVTDNSGFNFSLGNDLAGDYYEAGVTDVWSMSSLTLAMQNTVSSNVFSGTFNDSVHNEKFYQLQLLPQDILNIDEDKKALIMLDFRDNNSSINAQTVIDGLKNELLSDFNQNDSINIMISGMVTTALSNQWLPCDSATITDLFSDITPSVFSNFSNLPTLFIDGIEFIQSHGNYGSIVLISNANSHASLNEAESLIENIFDQMGTNPIPVHTIDLDNVNSTNEYFWANNIYYRGNQYLYSSLASQTSSHYLRLYEESYSSMLATVSQRLSSYLNNFEIAVTLDQGYTYANYEIGQVTNLTWLHEPYNIIGKYMGTGSFSVTISGDSPTGQSYSESVVIDNNNTVTLDKATRSLWIGQQLRDLYTNYTQSESLITQIIYTSMGERVLTHYTAFLALEPGMGPLNGDDGGSNLGVEDMIENMVSFEVYPNPANEIAYLNYYLPYDAHLTVELFDLFGKRVALLDNGNKAGGNYKLELNAAALETGTYVCRMIVDNEEVITRKLVVVR
jgi:hypothetical protein